MQTDVNTSKIKNWTDVKKKKRADWKKSIKEATVRIRAVVPSEKILKNKPQPCVCGLKF